MKKYLVMALLCGGLTQPAWSQQQSDPAPSIESVAESQSDQLDEQEQKDEVADELAEEQASEEFAEGEGTFSPTEKIKVDSAVSFPVGI